MACQLFVFAKEGHSERKTTIIYCNHFIKGKVFMAPMPPKSQKIILRIKGSLSTWRKQIYQKNLGLQKDFLTFSHFTGEHWKPDCLQGPVQESVLGNHLSSLAASTLPWFFWNFPMKSTIVTVRLGKQVDAIPPAFTKGLLRAQPWGRCFVKGYKSGNVAL